MHKFILLSVILVLNLFAVNQKEIPDLTKKEDLILVCGSLFVVGEFRTLFKSAG